MALQRTHLTICYLNEIAPFFRKGASVRYLLVIRCLHCSAIINLADSVKLFIFAKLTL